ncbi:MAG TPA: ABC transporter permease, partial [Vicinamibacterales bacterium]
MSVQHFRILARGLRRQPLLTSGVIAVIALAVGANTAIFTVFDRVLLRPLPLREPARLVTIAIAKPGNDRFPLSLPDFEDFRAQNRTFEGMTACFGWSVNLTGGDAAERLQAMRVSPNYFQLTGAEIELGRAIQPDDEGRSVAIVTHGLWQRRFGGAVDVIGKTLVLNGEGFTIVGVARPGFVSLVRDAEIVAPFAAASDPRRANRAQAFLRVIGRLKPAASPEQATDDLDGLSQRMRAAYPDAHGTDTGTRVRLLHDEISGRVAPMLRMLLAAVALVLLVACANIANLLLVRGAGRARELAVRSALGASRVRIMRQLVSEALVLGTLGGGLGLLVAHAFLDALIAIGPADLPRASEIAIDTRLVLFTLVLSIGASLLFGVIPALHASRGDLQDVLKGGDRAVSGGRGRLRAALIFSEVALSTLLLITAALLARSFQRVQEVDPGFRSAHVLS